MSFKVGQKVTYLTEHKCEHGIVKSVAGESVVFVVYYCNNDWDNYQNYTGAMTATKYLEDGWLELK